jgi:hypothetical protein
MRSVEKALGAKHVRLATEEEIEKRFPGYELGALPPIGSLFGIPTVVDPEVMEHDTVVFAAGSQMGSVKLRTQDLFRDEPVTIASLTRSSATGKRHPTRDHHGRHVDPDPSGSARNRLPLFGAGPQPFEMLRARSRMETMPMSVPPSITGRCRNPPSSILSIASPTVAAGPIVTGSRVMPFDIGETRAGSACM